MTDRSASTARRRTSSLQINVSTLLQESIGAVREFEIEEAEFAYEGPRTVAGSLQLLRTDRSLLAHGRLRTCVDEICGGCLAPLRLELALEFDEEFWPPTDALTGRAIEPPAERDGFAVLDGQLDLTEVVRQYVEMARPISPRCAADCPGLGSVSAEGEPPIDDRWAALASLREPQPGRSG